jgi:uracil-DNA glycosylase family 4
VTPAVPAGAALAALTDDIIACRACPRLVAWREEVALTRRAAYRDQEYWGRPVPGFGDPAARVVVVGLAPAAHGANRTGRMFTGDRSGDWLFAAMHRHGLANQPVSVGPDDGLVLSGAWVAAAVRCAPPGNKPTVDERDRCAPFLARELAALGDARVVVALLDVRPRPRFGHGVQVPGVQTPGVETPVVAVPGVEVPPAGRPTVIASYHPSQQNTFTGRLTEAMLDAVFAAAREVAWPAGAGPGA